MQASMFPAAAKVAVAKGATGSLGLGKTVGLLTMTLGSMTPLLVTASAGAALVYAGYRVLTWPACEDCHCGRKPRPVAGKGA
ncbi:MAG: hypothetical protein H7840_02050 [Alphaproteobacteria bacterium]